MTFDAPFSNLDVLLFFSLSGIADVLSDPFVAFLTVRPLDFPWLRQACLYIYHVKRYGPAG
ncbi:hypothetical protein, partial [Paenibacillus sonchi]|uniref:hypothetical protein n=1 Tax=Paenibacillus sonchi TaxID=373687 RepID=UPI001ADF3B0C